MIYAVIDTNVLVSALITHNSLSATRLLTGMPTSKTDNLIMNRLQYAYEIERI